MLTRPTAFEAGSNQTGAAAHFVLRISNEIGNDWYFSDTEMELGTVHVYDVDLSISEIDESGGGLFEEETETPIVSVTMLNSFFIRHTDDKQKRPSEIIGLAVFNSAKVYLAAGKPAAVSDLLLVFDGIQRTNIQHDDVTAELDLIDITADAHKSLPQVPMSTNFAGSVGDHENRHEPFAYGTFAIDDHGGGGLILAEQISEDDWLLTGHPLESESKLWIYLQRLGDFAEIIPRATMTLSANISATDTTFPVNSRQPIQNGDFLEVGTGTANAEDVQIKSQNSLIYTIEGSFANSHSTNDVVSTQYILKDDGGFGKVKLMRENREFVQGEIAYRAECYEVFAYIWPSKQGDTQIFAEHQRRDSFIVADSNSGQKVVNVDTARNFYQGQVIRIGQGSARDETKTVDLITGDTTLTVTVNLTNTHTAAQADNVQSNTYIHGEDVTDFDNLRDRRSDTFATLKVAYTSGTPEGYANVLLAFPDAGTIRSNVENDIGFILDMDVQIHIEEEVAVSFSTGTLLHSQTGRQVAGTISRFKTDAIIGSVSHQTKDLQAGASVLFLLLGDREVTDTPTVGVNSGQKIYETTNANAKKFNVGSRLIIGENTGLEESAEVTAIDDTNNKLTLKDNLRFTHGAGQSAAERKNINTQAIGIFWAFGTGDKVSGLGYQLRVAARTLTGGKTALGTAIARIYDVKLRVKALVYGNIFSSGILVQRIDENHRSGRPHVRSGGTKGWGSAIPSG